MAHYLDPKHDLTFKTVFGQHKNLCISLINSMLPLKFPVVSIEYQSGELLPELAEVLRNTIVDVRCTDSADRQFVVEMQLYWYESFKQRVLLNASKAYILQLEKAQEFKLLKPVYSLSFVNENFEHSKKMKNVYFHHYKIVNINHTEKQIEGLEFAFIELKKFKPKKLADKLLHNLWLRFLTEIDETTTEIPREMMENELISEALRYMEKSAYTKEQLVQYDYSKINLLSAKSMLSDAETKGIEQGITIGIEQGRAESEAERAKLEAERAKLEAELKAMATRMAELEQKKG